MKTFIVGGGNSVTEEHYRLLNQYSGDKFIIAVNFAYKFCSPDIIIFLDQDVYFKNRTILDNKNALLVSKKFDTYPQNIKQIIPSSEIGKKDALFAGKGSFLSGIFALSYAEYKEHKEIYLLGYDSCAVNGKLHHHEFSRDKDVFSRQIENFAHFNAKNITNCSIESRIPFFTKRRLEDVIGTI